MLVEGLSNSLMMFGTEIPGDMTDEGLDESAARKSEITALRWKLATVSQRREFGKPDA